MVKALTIFRQQNNNFLPLSQKIPDMTSITNYYLDLKKIFNEKNEEDIKILSKIID